MILKGTILLLCVVGLYASATMYRKSRRERRGELSEPSVVQTARARALGNVPNSLFGLAYYALLALALGFFGMGFVWNTAFLAVLAAAVFSVYLAYSLLYVTRMPCPFCWTSHAINWILVPLVLALRP